VKLIVGIGNPGKGCESSRAARAVACIVADGAPRAMSLFNA
jgi:peptidyl-tRNA hydrolase